MKRIFRKLGVYVIAVLLLAISSTVSIHTTHAQEINPTPGTYSYGSTSEFSPYATISQGSSSSLAPTGQDMIIGYIALAAILIIGGGTTYALVRNKKRANKSEISS